MGASLGNLGAVGFHQLSKIFLAIASAHLYKAARSIVFYHKNKNKNKTKSSLLAFSSLKHQAIAWPWVGQYARTTEDVSARENSCSTAGVCATYSTAGRDLTVNPWQVASFNSVGRLSWWECFLGICGGASATLPFIPSQVWDCVSSSSSWTWCMKQGWQQQSTESWDSYYLRSSFPYYLLFCVYLIPSQLLLAPLYNRGWELFALYHLEYMLLFSHVSPHFSWSYHQWDLKRYRWNFPNAIGNEV